MEKMEEEAGISATIGVEFQRLYLFFHEYLSWVDKPGFASDQVQCLSSSQVHWSLLDCVIAPKGNDGSTSAWTGLDKTIENKL